MSKTYRLQWDREFKGESVSTRVRYRRTGGEWCEVDSTDDLPPDVRRAYEHVRKMTEFDADSVGDTPRLRFRRRRPTRSREVDRTLYLDHPWLDVFILLMVPIAAIYSAYLAWPGLLAGGWTALGSWLLLVFAAAMSYYGLCVLLNVTEYRIEEGWLKVRHGPLPWPGNVQIPTDQILQISTRVQHSRYSLSYSLWATVAGRHPVRLAEGIQTAAEAGSIERAIERHLGIEDWE